MKRDEWVREMAEKALRKASLTPELSSDWTMKEYRRYYEGKRITFWELLSKPRLPMTEFPLPWDEQRRKSGHRRQIIQIKEEHIR